jgi:hypothetical protein
MVLSCCYLSAQTNDRTTYKSPKGVSIEAMDSELKLNKSENNNILWINALSLSVEGRGWETDIENYTRIPNHFKDTVTSKVWNLSRHSVGLSIHFVISGTSFIEARWTLRENRYMAHMTPQAINGLDLYVKLNGKWQWAGVGKPDKDGLQQKALLKKGFLPEKEYECRLYLPLYTGISNLELGFSPSAEIESDFDYAKKPLVFYGTSILHGCSASRPGMSFASMLGRHFDMPVVNLGFSGNGFMESYFATILGEIEASVYVIDCLPNMSRFSKEEIYKRILELIEKLHKISTEKPIIIVEDRSYTHPNLTGKETPNYRRLALKAAYGELRKEIKNVYYIEGDALLGFDNEATVDGSHPSDLGMYRYFSTLRNPVSKVLRRNAK